MVGLPISTPGRQSIRPQRVVSHGGGVLLLQRGARPVWVGAHNRSRPTAMPPCYAGATAGLARRRLADQRRSVLLGRTDLVFAGVVEHRDLDVLCLAVDPDGAGVDGSADHRHP